MDIVIETIVEQDGTIELPESFINKVANIEIYDGNIWKHWIRDYIDTNRYGDGGEYKFPPVCIGKKVRIEVIF